MGLTYIYEAKKQVSPTKNPLKKNTHFLRSTSTHHSAGLFPSRNSIHNFSFLPHHLPWCAHKPNSRTLCFAFLGFIPYSNTLRVYPAPIMVGPDPSKVIDKVLMSSRVHNTYQENWLKCLMQSGPITRITCESYISGGAHWIRPRESFGPIQILRTKCNASTNYRCKEFLRVHV